MQSPVSPIGDDGLWCRGIGPRDVTTGSSAGSTFSAAADGGVLSFVGQQDRWKDPARGETVMSCTILVTEANAMTQPIQDRMAQADEAMLVLGPA
jgi:hypothetical protein